MHHFSRCCLLWIFILFCHSFGIVPIVSIYILFYIQPHFYAASRSSLLAGLATSEHRLPYAFYVHGRNWTVFLNLISKTLCLTVSAPSPSFHVGGQDSNPALRALHSLSLVPDFPSCSWFFPCSWTDWLALLVSLQSNIRFFCLSATFASAVTGCAVVDINKGFPMYYLASTFHTLTHFTACSMDLRPWRTKLLFSFIFLQKSEDTASGKDGAAHCSKGGGQAVDDGQKRI